MSLLPGYMLATMLLLAVTLSDGVPMLSTDVSTSLLYDEANCRWTHGLVPCLPIRTGSDVTDVNIIKRLIPKKFYQLARLRTGMNNASEEARIRTKLLQRLRQLMTSGAQRHTDE